jgi:AsmA protein
MKRILKIVAIVVVLAIAVAVALPFVIDANQFRPTLETKLTAALGREVKLGDLKLSVFNWSVAASELSVADDPGFSKTPFLRAKSLQVGVELVPLILSRKLNVTGVLIDQPEVDVWQNAAGTWNFSSLGAKTAPGPATPAPTAAPSGSESAMDLTVKLIKITDGRFSLGETGGTGKPEVLDKVNLELRDFSAGTAFPFSLDASFAGGGGIKLNGKAGPLDQADAAATPFDATLSITHLDLIGSGFVNPATGLGGLASVDGSASSTGNMVTIKGKLTAENLKLAKGGTPAKPKVEVDIAVVHDMKKRGGSLEQGAIHIGKANANLTGTYAQGGETTSIQMKLAGPKMPVDDLAAMLPALNIALPNGASLQGGTATVELASHGPLTALQSEGSLSVDNTTLANFDLGTKLKTMERLTGTQAGQNTQVQTLSMQVAAAPDGTKVDKINLVVPTIGTLTGSGTVSPAQELDFHVLVAVHTPGGVMAALGGKGDTSVPLTVTGTASNPVFKPDLKSVAGQEIMRITGNPGGSVTAAEGVLNLFKKK